MKQQDNPHDEEQPQETTSTPEDAVLAVLQQDLAVAKRQADEFRDDLQRERASFANYKRRIDQENAEIYQRSLGDIARTFLPVVDDLERSLKHRPADANAQSWVDGVDLILKKLLTTLQNQGIKPLDAAPGDAFDPAMHEAISHEENEQFSDGQIIEVVQTGYRNNDRIIRPALVRVAK